MTEQFLGLINEFAASHKAVERIYTLEQLNQRWQMYEHHMRFRPRHLYWGDPDSVTKVSRSFQPEYLSSPTHRAVVTLAPMNYAVTGELRASGRDALATVGLATCLGVGVRMVNPDGRQLHGVGHFSTDPGYALESWVHLLRQTDSPVDMVASIDEEKADNVRQALESLGVPYRLDVRRDTLGGILVTKDGLQVLTSSGEDYSIV